MQALQFCFYILQHLKLVLGLSGQFVEFVFLVVDLDDGHDCVPKLKNPTALRAAGSERFSPAPLAEAEG